MNWKEKAPLLGKVGREYGILGDGYTLSFKPEDGGKNQKMVLST